MSNLHIWFTGFIVGFSFGSFFISKRVKSVIERIKGHQCPPQTIHVFGPGGGGGSSKIEGVGCGVCTCGGANGIGDCQCAK